MAHQSALIAEDIHAYLKAQEEKSLLRFITCGSVDDGKSTLIGRLLWDSKMIFEDQLAALEADSKKVGTQGERIDYALLLDGLQAEREQGITIDVAYRFFSTDKRKFIVADTPGHEQYTRNMVTGASTAQVAIILVDARKGGLTQTRRHSYLVSLVGIRHIVLAVNKMDLVDYSEDRFAEILRDYESFAAGLGFDRIQPIPISALEGDNILAPGGNTPWYQGPTLMEYLETVPVAETDVRQPFRLPVQWVNRPHLDFRGFCGTIAAGTVRPGDELAVASSGRKSRVARIVTANGDLAEAVAGQAVTLTLTDEIDISRGDVLADPEDRPHYANRFEAKLVWLHEEPLQTGRGYLLKSGSATAPVQVSNLRFKVNVNTLQREDGATLDLNEIGVCHLATGRPIAFDSYRANRATGGFILIDRLTNATVAAGMIHQPLIQSGGRWQDLELNRQTRAAHKGQQARILWLSGSVPRGLAALLEKKLHSQGRHTALLDGGQLHAGLNRDLGDGPADRLERTRRIAEAARLLGEAGLIALVVPGDGNRPPREIFDRDELLEIVFDGAAEAGEPSVLRVSDAAAAPEALAERIAGELARCSFGGAMIDDAGL
ncbi:sulfate adenylyltransferase subunit CysN [Trichloromonas acetexigens]|uniref:Sulfate adenylyltransferase subunit 1 n=1 Tax=Trichloromonas acetexigens TaxID=38815 RepID=A0A550JJ42_9BACT|nr:sulfate adenylyltransferase subunit CysN [Desulfuromonas acetexigens]TRO83236.1 sulfate adenylyltransferase subunit CysN [Desulfuromonas acetexigens]